MRSTGAWLFLSALALNALEPCSARASVSVPASDFTYVKAVYSLPLSLDPIQMNDTASLVAANLIYDGLLRFSPTLEIEGALADSWSTSPDGRTITFKLRSGAKFHDGSDVTAEDVVFSLTRAVSSESKVQKLYDCIAGASGGTDLGIRALDSKTVTITLTHPFPPFLSILAGATAKILPKRSITKKGFFENPIGSGPFRLIGREERPLRKIILEAFADHYRGKPKLSRLVLLESTEGEALKMATGGEVHDLANWPLTGTEPVFKTGHKHSAPVAATWIIGLNTFARPFRSKAVRRAFRDSVDVEGFRKKFFADALPAYGYVPPGLPGYIALGKRPGKPSSVRTQEKIRIVIPDVLQRHVEMKAFLEADLKAKGWTVEVIPMAWDKLMEGYAKKSHQAFLVSMNMDYPDAEFLLRNFESTNSDNFSGIKDPKIDAFLGQARSIQDRRQRQELHRLALALINDAAVTVNLFHPRTHLWADQCVRGIRPNILSDVYIDYAQVALDAQCTSKLLGAK